MKPKIAIGDADAIIAQVNQSDLMHDEAMEIVNRLIVNEINVLYPVTAIVEATTFIQRVINSGSTAYGVAKLFTDPQVQIVEVNGKTLSNALRLFSPPTSKKNTLFDCIVAAVAHEYNTDLIFSFDKFYKKNGFRLVSQL